VTFRKKKEPRIFKEMIAKSITTADEVSEIYIKIFLILSIKFSNKEIGN
jgi:hypothetical protein